jgi:AcrR family transcriptional regulator
MGRTDTSAKILAAADEILAEAGYDGASVGRVAERAGVNKALVFYHFENKAGLIQRVLEQYFTAHQVALEDAFAAKGPLRERLHGVVDAYFEFMSEHRTYPRLVQGLMNGDEESKKLVVDNLTSLFTYTTKMLEEVTPKSGPLAAKQFYSTFSGMVTGYFTYGPALRTAWGADPFSKKALEDRLAHIHWMVDAVLDRLEAEQDRPGGA